MMSDQELRNRDLRNQELRNRDLQNRDLRQQDLRQQELVSGGFLALTAAGLMLLCSSLLAFALA